MQIDSDDIVFLVGDMNILSDMAKTPALPAFSREVIEFLSDLSRELLRNSKAKTFVDIVSYAYWIRKASIESVHLKHKDCSCRIGRGVAFHIAPSNVPVNFAVSMTSSILAGNCTLVRVSQKEFSQVDIICNAMNKLLNSTHKNMKQYFCIIKYEHSDKITSELSSICDIRVIWGGDRTIDTIRKFPIPTRAIEMAFADRHSIAVIHSNEYLNENPEEVAKGFYTDTYYTDQNACSSPRLIVWTGTAVEEAKERFWKQLGFLVKKEYQMKPIQAVDKYTSLCSLSMKETGYHLISSDNYIVRIEVDHLTSELMDYKNGGGYFFEYTAENLEEIVPVLTKQCQTISVLGIAKEIIKELIFQNGVRGGDRIVTLGKTMELAFIWDGYKMIENMSRFVYIGDD